MDAPLTRTRVATGTIRQYRFCKGTTTDGQATEASANDDPVLGVAQLAAGAGQQVDLVILGYSKLKLGGTVQAGELLMPHTDGTAVSATSGNRVCAMALNNGLSGDIIDAALTFGIY